VPGDRDDGSTYPAPLRMPQALSHEHFLLWIRSECAVALSSIVRGSASPHLDAPQA